MIKDTRQRQHQQPAFRKISPQPDQLANRAWLCAIEPSRRMQVIDRSRLSPQMLVKRIERASVTFKDALPGSANRPMAAPCSLDRSSSLHTAATSNRAASVGVLARCQRGCVVVSGSLTREFLCLFSASSFGHRKIDSSFCWSAARTVTLVAAGPLDYVSLNNRGECQRKFPQTSKCFAGLSCRSPSIASDVTAQCSTVRSWPCMIVPPVHQASFCSQTGTVSVCVWW